MLSQAKVIKRPLEKQWRKISALGLTGSVLVKQHIGQFQFKIVPRMSLQLLVLFSYLN